GGEKCMDLRFLRLRRWLLKQQPNKTVFNRFIKTSISPAVMALAVALTGPSRAMARTALSGNVFFLFC
ncbi:MAG: hypothetical protein KHX05_10580, partial [Firmicutes bacterium]|nr:hypothetical protein [Bacillota bacterium]